MCEVLTKKNKNIKISNFQLLIDQIGQHFSQFGCIKSLTASYNNNSRYVFIVFENSRSAQAAVMVPTHRINQYSVNVDLNDSYSSFFDIDWQLVSPHQESPMHILNILPDECLINIFKSLEVKDLCNAADTSTKFRKIAKDTFKNRFSQVDEKTVDEMDSRTLARFLRNFGPLITTHVLNCRKLIYGTPIHYMNLFFLHCAVPERSLRELTIKNASIAIRNIFREELKILTSRLRTLKHENCEGRTHGFGIKSTGRR